MTDDEGAIRDLASRWMDASKAGDVATLKGLMTDDVVFMTVGGEPFGKQAFLGMAEGMRNVAFEGRSDILEVGINSDIAWMRSHIAVTVTPPNATPVRRAGHTLTLLRKDAGGQWRISRDANLLTVVS